MANAILQVGTKGLYHPVAPFQTTLISGMQYTCIAIRRIADIQASGEDPQALYYTPVGLSAAIYTADAYKGACIISLQGESGDLQYIPDSYIQQYPDIGGIPYTTLLLAISIGAIPDSLDLSYLKSKIASVVLENVGIVSDVRSVIVSPTAMLSNTLADTLETARLGRITTVMTDYAQLISVTAQRDSALLKITQLENYIYSLNP